MLFKFKQFFFIAIYIWAGSLYKTNTKLKQRLSNSGNKWFDF